MQEARNCVQISFNNSKKFRSTIIGDIACRYESAIFFPVYKILYISLNYDLILKSVGFNNLYQEY